MSLNAAIFILFIVIIGIYCLWYDRKYPSKKIPFSDVAIVEDWDITPEELAECEKILERWRQKELDKQNNQ